MLALACACMCLPLQLSESAVLSLLGACPGLRSLRLRHCCQVRDGGWVVAVAVAVAVLGPGSDLWTCASRPHEWEWLVGRGLQGALVTEVSLGAV